MNSMIKNLRRLGIAAIAAMIGISAVSALGQEKEKVKLDKEKIKAYAEYEKSKGFCQNNNWSNGDKVSVSNLREVTVASTGTINVDAGRNGGITVKGEDRSDVLIRACVQAWGADEAAARANLGNVRIDTGSQIKADGPTGNDYGWSVSFQIIAPRNSNTKLKAHNGGISISGVDGNAEFETLNGGVNVKDASGSVKGRTTNGGVNVTLVGTTWRGSGIDVETKNGGVNLTVPANFAANIEAGTVNGGFKSDIPALNVTTEDNKGDSWHRSRNKRVQMALNGGGPPVRVVTTNGGVKINSLDQ